jgi:hypothetical protein
VGYRRDKHTRQNAARLEFEVAFRLFEIFDRLVPTVGANTWVKFIYGQKTLKYLGFIASELFFRELSEPSAADFPETVEIGEKHGNGNFVYPPGRPFWARPGNFCRFGVPSRKAGLRRSTPPTRIGFNLPDCIFSERNV